MNNDRYGCEFTRKLWTDLDHILLVYVGSAAEFALVEENHWLFYTNKLPSAPLERLLSTFAWNRKVMMTTSRDAEQLGKTIRGFHDQVENERSHEEGGHPKISNRAFRAVGSMLIEYALLAEAYLERREVSAVEKENYYFDQVGFFRSMGIKGWEESYQLFHENRTGEREEELKVNRYTADMFDSYRKDLGALRCFLLKNFMAWFVPEPVRKELNLTKAAWFKPLYRLYPRFHRKKLSGLIHRTLLPGKVLKGMRMA